MSGRGKGKGAAVFDFIALGGKGGSGGGKGERGQAGAAAPHSGPQLIQSTSGSNLLMKKSVVVGSKPSSGAAASTPPGSSGSSGAATSVITSTNKKSDRYLQWEELAREVNPLELVDLVERSGEMETIEAYLCGAVKSLRKERAKPDQVVWLSLMYLAKSDPKLFLSGYVREALCSLLKRDVKESFKSKGNSLVPVSAVAVLMQAYQEEKHWPEIFVRVYMDDAIGERVWVDHPDAKPFVDNILTAFNTILPPQVRGGGGGGSGGEGGSFGACPSPPTGSSGSRTPTRGDEEIQIIDLPINTDTDLDASTGVSQRYTAQQEYIETLVMNTVREKFNSRQGADNITRNFLRFLAFACGLGKVRHAVVSKLEMWLINQKISRPAQDLLLAVTHNCNTHSESDIEVMSYLSKLRLKTKPNINLYMASLRDLCTAHPDNLPTMMKQTIFNELSNARNNNNMPMLAVMFQTDPEKAAASLANVFMELLLQKDCYLRALRLLLREIFRCLRYDISISTFSLNLMIDARDKFKGFKEFEFKERCFMSIVDLITLSVFLGISPAVREAYNAYSKSEKKELTAYKIYIQSVCTIQKNATWWMLEVVPKLYKPDAGVYTSQLYKLLFMAPNLEEYRLDNWPGEAEFKITSEIPVHEESILRIFLIGLHKNLPLNGQDSLAIAETMIKKAAGLHPLLDKDFTLLYSDKAKQFLECVWELTAYTYPESIALPADYQPPSMAITASYWKAWQLLLIMSAHNPHHFGSLAWESYPTLRALMEMCITSQFVFPPSTLAATSEKLEEVRAQERQLAEIEKQEILEFESRLAAASSKQVITEKSSLLLSTITRMDPLGPLRCPPQAVLDQLKQMNMHYKLGHLLCRSRQPDFLLDILQRQGTNQAMPWLADLVESAEGSLSVLPVQCLCEFLLNDSLPLVESGPGGGKVIKKRKAGELLKHLQTILHHPETDAGSCLETLDYFLRRLSSLQSQARLQALSGLKMLVTPSVDSDDGMEVEDNDGGTRWLLEHLPALPCFPLAYQSIAAALRQACEIETDPATVSLYIRFLSQTCCAVSTNGGLSDLAVVSGGGGGSSLSDLADLALDMASVIVERSSLLPAILPNSQHIASISKEDQELTFQALLHVFNRYMLLVRQEKNSCEELPRAYLVGTGTPNTNTGEEALLIPDWLKLKMIRSCVSVLVDSALRDLEPHQLVLFIQSFGIPVESMSKLLQTLDGAVRADLKSVADSVLDKNYMGQLVAVQHRRGASGGTIFAKALGLNVDLGGGLSLAGGHLSTQQALTSVAIPPRSTAVIPPNQVRNTIVQVLEVGETVSRWTHKEKSDTFRTLQKYMTQELSTNCVSKAILEATIDTLHSLTFSPSLGDPLVKALKERSSYSCSLFRILTSALLKNIPGQPASCEGPVMSDSLSATLLNTITALAAKFKQLQIECPLSHLLDQFLSTVAARTGAAAVSKPPPLPLGGGGGTPQHLDINSESLESDIKKLAKQALSRERTGTGPLGGTTRTGTAGGTTSLCRALARVLTQDSGVNAGVQGLCLDWLQLVDPGVLADLPNLQADLIFAKGLAATKDNKENSAVWLKRLGRKRGRESRPYLLSLLTHQGSYSVLQSTVATVLDTFKSDLEPTAVLDFLSACIHIPRLWQGRHQNSGKNSKEEDILHLSVNAVKVLAEYILAEAVESGTHASLENRIPLILQSIQDKETKSSAFINTIISQADAADTGSYAKQLLLLLYMKLPRLLATRLSPPLSTNSLLRSGSCVDIISYTLLTNLANPPPGREGSLKMQDYDTCARKLVSCHPQLFLRNLALLVAGLQGRTQLDYTLFRIQNHLALFTICLGLLELARPHVFGSEHAENLEACLATYINMCSVYFQRRESFVGLIDKFVNFLNSWLAQGGRTAAHATKFLSNNSEVLIRLSSAPGTDRMASLRYLMSYSFSSTQLNNKTEDLEDDKKKSTELSSANKEIVCKRQDQDDICLQICSSSSGTSGCRLDKEVEILLASVAAPQPTESLVNSLQDLLRASLPRPELLIHFQDVLTNYIHHEREIVRSNAYTCLLRMLRQAPRTWRSVLPEYLAALQSEDSGIHDSACKHLPDFTIICQEEADTILTTVFRLGLYGGRMSVSGYLSDTITQLNAQVGR